MTATTVALAAVFAPVVAGGPGSVVLAIIVGNFVTTYVDGLTTEWTNKNEWFHQTILRRLINLKKLLLGQLPNQNHIWVVPDDVNVPSSMTCMITTNLFMEPCVLHDVVFEKEWLKRWIIETGSHPLNRNMQVSL